MSSPAPTPISQLPAAGALDGTEGFPAVQGGATKKGLLSQVLAYVTANLAAPAWAAITGKPAFGTAATLDAVTLAPLVSPAFTGTPTVPTAAPGTNSTQAASTAFAVSLFNGVLAGAPAALDTLKELADAINDDANFAASVTMALAGKATTAQGAKADAAAAVSGLLFCSAGTFAAATAANLSAALSGQDVNVDLNYGIFRGSLTVYGGGNSSTIINNDGPSYFRGQIYLGYPDDVGFARTAARMARAVDENGNTGTLRFKFPTSDPHVAGEWWDNGTTLVRSSG